MSEQELRAAVLDAWTRKEWLEFGERRWDPNQASLTVLEGPRLSLQELSMGRGWRNAQRGGSDVTERVLASARAAQTGAGGDTQADSEQAAVAAAADVEVASLAADLVVLLGEESLALMRAWQLALQRHPDRSPSECLALAEEFVRR